ncbi:unnamed protein product [Urochloa humidicola]
MAPPTPREAVGFLAQMALRLGRHDDLIEAMEVLAEQHSDLSEEEKQLIWTGYQSVFLDKHSLLKKLDAVGKEHDSSKFYVEIEMYQDVIEFELVKFCTKAVGFVEKYLLTSSHDSARWNKMIGDLCWYQSMVTDEDENKDILVHRALNAYKAASVVAENLLPAHPDRLTLLLNLSAFYFDEMNEEGTAMAMAEDGVHQSFQHMDLLDEDLRREATGILELIKDNLKNWAAQKAAKELSDAARSSTADEVTKITSADGLDEPEVKSAAAEADMKLAPEPEPEPDVNQEPELKPDHGLELDPEAEPEADAGPEAEPEADAGPEAEPEADADTEPAPKPAKEVYSTRSPSPVRTRAVSPPPRLTFAAAPPSGPEEGLTQYQIRQRRKASQSRRGMMG